MANLAPRKKKKKSLTQVNFLGVLNSDTKHLGPMCSMCLFFRVYEPYQHARLLIILILEMSFLMVRKMQNTWLCEHFLLKITLLLKKKKNSEVSF